MHIDPYIVLGSAIVGLLVGMTGAGGGALMTPMLILLFGVKPSAAISSDLVAAVVMRPIGAAVHLRAGTVNRGLVKWMVIGSVPAAFLGDLPAAPDGRLEIRADQYRAGARHRAAGRGGRDGAAVRAGPGHRPKAARSGNMVQPRPVLTVAIGVIGGLIVGLTSVGSGSLMIVLMLFAYPMIGANQLVGTDLTQAVPLTLAAALGALIFGHVDFGVTGSLIIGSVPARPRGFAAVLHHPRPLCSSRDRLRDLRLRAQVRGIGRRRSDGSCAEPCCPPPPCGSSTRGRSIGSRRSRSHRSLTRTNPGPMRC